MMFLLAVLLGSFVGLVLGLTGGGGAMVAMPLLIYLLKQDVNDAALISLATVFISASFGVVQRLSSKNIDFQVGGVFAFFGMIGSHYGVKMRNEHLDEQLVVKGFACIMLIVATLLVIRSVKELRVIKREEVSCSEKKKEKEFEKKDHNFLILTVLALFVGMISGIFGIGGGFLIAPILTFLYKMPTHRSVSTSLLVIIPISFSGFMSELIEQVDEAASMWEHMLSLKMLYFFILGSLIGVTIGSIIKSRVPSYRLNQAFASILIILAAYMLFTELPGEIKQKRKDLKKASRFEIEGSQQVF